MKTAIQELIDWVETRDIRVYQNKYAFKQAILTKLNQGLEKEKEQFDDMFEEGFESYYQHFVNGKDFVKFEEYYNQTYNQNKNL